jgi:hypothetical protein
VSRKPVPRRVDLANARSTNTEIEFANGGQSCAGGVKMV